MSNQNPDPKLVLELIAGVKSWEVISKDKTHEQALHTLATTVEDQMFRPPMANFCRTKNTAQHEAKTNFDARKEEMDLMGRFEEMEQASKKAKREHKAAIPPLSLNTGKSLNPRERIERERKALERAAEAVSDIARKRMTEHIAESESNNEGLPDIDHDASALTSPDSEDEVTFEFDYDQFKSYKRKGKVIHGKHAQQKST